MPQGNITLQSCGAIMAMTWFSWVKLLSLLYRSSSPYITGISDQDYLALRAGYTQAIGGWSFFFNSWKHSSSLAVPLQGVIFLGE